MPCAHAHAHSKMPNWCNNQATFKHEDDAMMARLNGAAERHAAWSRGDKVVGFFQEFVPWPAEYDSTWCRQNWGTEKDAFDMDVKLKEGSFNFNTAWVPPIAFYEEMISLGFEVEAFFFEGGCGLCGSFVDGTRENFSIDTAAERAHVPGDLAKWAWGDGEIFDDEEKSVAGHGE